MQEYTMKNTVNTAEPILIRPFFIIDWFTDPPTLLFGKLKKK